METCDSLTGEGLRSCYAQFGCDAGRVRAFYAPVAALERQWEEAAEGASEAATASGPRQPQHTRPALSARGSPAGTTLDEDEYGEEGGQQDPSSSSDRSPAPWWPLGLPPLWGG